MVFHRLFDVSCRVGDKSEYEGEMSMGVWYKPQEWFKKFRRKKDLREICREKYGDDFVEMYDMVNNGIPIGNLRETQLFLAMVKPPKEE